MVRSSVATEGKRITFNVDEHYCLENDNPEKIFNEVFDGLFASMPFALGYTKVVEDKGHDKDLIPYNNGLVGYQNFCFYGIEAEVLNEFCHYSKLSADSFGGLVWGQYTDVTIFKNPKV